MNFRLTIVACTAALAVAGCGATPTTPDTAPAPELDPVLELIGSLTDCAAIQEQFELAFSTSEHADPLSDMHQAAVSHMDAADERLGAVGC